MTTADGQAAGFALPARPRRRPQTLTTFLAARPGCLKKGPLAIILIEDDSAVVETIDHHLGLGFRHILALSPEPFDLPDRMIPKVTNLLWDTRRPAAHVGAVNAVIAAVPPKTWLYYCFNTEFLFYPFSEHRHVGEMLAFHTEERRPAMLSYVVDLYAGDIGRHPDGLSLDHAMFDRTGYYSLGRQDADGRFLDRQMNFHGGLRWRFEEHLPKISRRIDRVSLFTAARDLKVTADHRFNVEEYNTFACPWHHNLTAAIGSFRVAKALLRNPGSRSHIRNFVWRNSHPFEWRAQQLMDLGLMEPGQWF